MPASFPVILGDFDVTSPVKLVGKIRTRFQGFSDNLDSANWPECGKHPSCSSTAKLIYGKTSRNKRATCSVTLLQKELNRDVVRFTTHENKPCNLVCCKTGSNVGG